MMAAAAAFALVAGNAEAVDVRATMYPGVFCRSCVTLWYETFRSWAEAARDEGAKCAIGASMCHSMGVWSSDAYSVSAMAATLGITTENLAREMADDSWNRTVILYLEQQKMIEGVLDEYYSP